MALSGPEWVSKFPTSRSLDDLIEPFRTNVKKFVAALKAAGASVTIADTLRPPERAYLMHFSFAIAREGLDPAKVPAMTGVDIQWVHPGSPGMPGANASKDAAEKMVLAYGIAFRPVLHTRHTEGRAIDMSIAWTGDIAIAKGDGTSVAIISSPRNHNNASLHDVGKSWGVIKLATDPPHWSSDGH